MKTAADFRRIAREALKGKWWFAVAVGLVATLLGGATGVSPNIELNINSGSGADVTLDFAGQSFSIDTGILFAIAGLLIAVLIIVLVFSVIYFIIASFITVGYSHFNLNLVDNKEADFGTLFSHYKNWKTTAVSSLLRTVYIFLWTLLLIVPGIIAAYRYALADFILAENPEISASQSIDISDKLMSGNKWRLFCLEFSFIGWDILTIFTLGIGNLWLIPYKYAAKAAFYRDICGTNTKQEAVQTTFEDVSSSDDTHNDSQE